MATKLVNVDCTSKSVRTIVRRFGMVSPRYFRGGIYEIKSNRRFGPFPQRVLIFHSKGNAWRAQVPSGRTSLHIDQRKACGSRHVGGWVGGDKDGGAALGVLPGGGWHILGLTCSTVQDNIFDLFSNPAQPPGGGDGSLLQQNSVLVY